MFKFKKQGVKKSSWRLATTFFLSLCFVTQGFSETVKAPSMDVFQQRSSTRAQSWKRFYSIPGNCSINFPMQPQHVQQVTPIAEGKHQLRCDIYAAPFERKAVYMMLIAQYPTTLGDMHTKLSLEGILNGLLMQNPNGQLVFADIIEIGGYKALDFSIQSEGIQFEGRVLVTENNLYLLAMKCDKRHYSKDQYLRFINSFQLSQSR